MKIFTGAILLAAISTPAAAQVELATNGDFETGDTSGWQYFPTGDSTFIADPAAPPFGSFNGNLRNIATGSAAVIKQANLGIGQVDAGDEVTISFWARAFNTAGGVNFAEFFTELDGGGTSSSQILGGAPLSVTENWQQFSFITTAGPDASGGLTLQFTATTGANIGSISELQLDEVSVTIVPAPAAATALALTGLVAMRRRR
jgi:hypothetical protein